MKEQETKHTPAMPSPRAVLEKILRAHESGNNGAYMGEAVLCRHFENMARAALNNPVHVPRILVTVSGGKVQSIEADAPTDVIVLDFDTEGSDAATFETPNGSHAFVIPGPFADMSPELSDLFNAAKAFAEKK